MKPCIKWVGGKTQIIDTVTKSIPLKINTYYELFVGGGSVLIELLNKVERGEIKIKKFVVNDSNENLINMYNCIKSKPSLLIKRLKLLNDHYSKAKLIEYNTRHKHILDPKLDINQIIKKGKSYVFYYYRNEYNSKKLKGLDVNKAALFIFLNKTSFRGLYRVGPNGFNTSFGNYNNPAILDKENIIKLSKCFNKYSVTFLNKDFTKCFNKLNKTDFCYLDPPYYPLKKTSFVGYSKDGFKDKHKVVLDLCNNLNKNGIKFVHSNSWCRFNCKNYKGYKQSKILCSRRINSKNPSDTDYEILISN